MTSVYSIMTKRECPDGKGDKSPDEDRLDVSTKKQKNSSDDEHASLSLLDLVFDEGPLRTILTYLDRKSLAMTESVCKVLRQTVTPLWDKVVETDLPSLGTGDGIWSAKKRLFRWQKASEYSKRMELLASSHHDLESLIPARMRCKGCKELPDLDETLFKYEHSDCFQDYFVRLSYRNTKKPEQADRLICQGFAELIVAENGRRSFPLEDIYRPENVSWPELEHLKPLFLAAKKRHDEALAAEYIRSLKKCMDNVVVTIVSVRGMQPWTCGLVVSTEGFIMSPVEERMARMWPSSKAKLQGRGVVSHNLFRKPVVETGFDFTNRGVLISVELKSFWSVFPYQNLRSLYGHSA